MDEKRIKELFQQAGETLQAILEYFRLKDKVLWTGSAGKGKTITVPNLSKYSLIRIRAVYGDFLVNTSTGRVGGIYGDRAGSSDTLVTGLLFASISGDLLTINNCNWVVHNPSGSHGAISQTTITEIVGIDPVIPTALQNIIGGGYFIGSPVWRWAYEIIYNTLVARRSYKNRLTAHTDRRLPHSVGQRNSYNNTICKRRILVHEHHADISRCIFASSVHMAAGRFGRRLHKHKLSDKPNSFKRVYKALGYQNTRDKCTHLLACHRSGIDWGCVA